MCLQATKVSADGEQVEDDADRIHNGAEDLEQFIKDILLGAKGSRKAPPVATSKFCQHISSFSLSIYCIV